MKSTKAEQRAWEAYPYDGGTKGLICYAARPVFIQGYEQAEEDLALTWEDVMSICEHYVDVNYEYGYHSIQEKYEEILRRFKEAKK